MNCLYREFVHTAATFAWKATRSNRIWRSTSWPIRKRMERTEKIVRLQSCHLPLLPTTSFINATSVSKSCPISVILINTSRCATWIRWTILMLSCIIIIIRMEMAPPRWQLSSRKRSQLRLKQRHWTKARTTLIHRRWCLTFITICNSTLNTTISNLRQVLPPLIIKFWQQMDTSLQTF